MGENCDDGGRVSGDGCSSTCLLETLPRTYTYSLTSYTIQYETNTSTGTINPTNADCQSPYLPAEFWYAYNPFPTGGSCYIGAYCYNCWSIKFPGYPVIKNRFHPDSPFGVLAHTARGKLRAFSNGTQLAFSLVVNNRSIIKNNKTDLVILHYGLGAVRFSMGRYYIQSWGTNKISLYLLSNDTTLSCMVQFLVNSTKNVPPQLGNDAYMWWPGPNLLLSRQYNGRNIDFYSIFNNTPDTVVHPSNYASNLLLDGAFIPPLQITGDILMDPVYRNDLMHVPLYIEDFAVPSNKVYQVNIYQAQLPWAVVLQSTVTVPNQIISIASFQDGVVLTMNNANPFWDVTSNVAVTITYNVTTPVCSTYVTPVWTFFQFRPDPDSTNETKQVYVYCNATQFYPAYYSNSTHKIMIDTYNAITLPDELPLSRHKTGRFNLSHPFDVSGRWLVNLAIQPCSSYMLYRWDEYNAISASIYDFQTGSTSCMDIPIADTLFA